MERLHTLEVMTQAPQRIDRLATELKRACSPGQSAEYVGYKLTAAIARQVRHNLSSPALALEYAKRMQLLLMELAEHSHSGGVEQLRYWTEQLIAELEHEAERVAMDRLLEQWREGLMS